MQGKVCWDQDQSSEHLAVAVGLDLGDGAQHGADRLVKDRLQSFLC